MDIIDVHNHTLPFIDDGAKDLEMSIAMLRLAAESGTKEIVLTPHHLNGAFINFSNDVINNTKTLQQAAYKAGIKIKLHYGSEVHLVPETVEHILNNKALSYCGLGKAALIELPKHSIPAGSESILSRLIHNGITPIIAHPERNAALRQDSAQLKEWVAFGCKSQVTGQSCNGEFGIETQKAALRMILEGLVHVVASDAHRPHGRSPNLRLAATSLSKTFNNEVAQLLLHDNPKRLIEGKTLVPVKISEDLKLQVEKEFSLFKKSKLAKPKKRKSLIDRLRSIS